MARACGERGTKRAIVACWTFERCWVYWESRNWAIPGVLEHSCLGIHPATLSPAAVTPVTRAGA
jgi:hypothetical protein